MTRRQSRQRLRSRVGHNHPPVELSCIDVTAGDNFRQALSDAIADRLPAESRASTSRLPKTSKAQRHPYDFIAARSIVHPAHRRRSLRHGDLPRRRAAPKASCNSPISGPTSRSAATSPPAKPVEGLVVAASEVSSAVCELDGLFGARARLRRRAPLRRAGHRRARSSQLGDLPRRRTPRRQEEQQQDVGSRREGGRSE